MQSITIIGWVGKDPQEHHTQDEKKVTNISVCVSCHKKGEDIPVWYQVKVWGNQFEKIVKSIKKGTHLIVEGELEPPTISKDSANPRVYLSINATRLRFGFLKSKEEEAPSILEELKKEKSLHPEELPF